MLFILLTIVGFGLILVDLLIIPGSVLVVAGSIMIIYAVYLNYVANGFWWAGLHLAICLACVPKLVVWSLRRVSLTGEMDVKKGYVGVADYSVHLGKRGRTLSVMRPSGSVSVQDETGELHLDCVARNGYIDAGTEVEIVEVRGPSLLVAPVKQA